MMNKNMPVRFLFYLAEEYQKVIEKAEFSLYGSEQITLPAPKCVMFYNGEKDADKDAEESWEMCLSDALMEVIGMLLREFDAEKYERTIREEGQIRISELFSRLLSQNRIEELTLAANDAAYQEKLLREMGL